MLLNYVILATFTNMDHLLKIVATVAFGMGLDKSNIGAVCRKYLLYVKKLNRIYYILSMLSFFL